MNSLKSISKKLSYHLRHAPEKIGIDLDSGGWVEIEVLLAALTQDGWSVTRAELDRVVAENDKKRFAISDDGLRIRASQGHSVEVDLQLVPQRPPRLLYHGTGEGAVRAILREGIQRMRRTHVHLSADRETAEKVGARHGRPHVFVVEAMRMRADGHEFYLSENGVWLTFEVPARYIVGG